MYDYIETDRLILRKARLDDLDDIYNNNSNEKQKHQLEETFAQNPVPRLDRFKKGWYPS